MVRTIFWTLMAAVHVYAVIPTILIRTFGIGACKGRHGKGIALTFDDGPHPEYTPQVLDLLNQYHVKASFFVLGARAERFPALIKRMHQEGHMVGVHNYSHRANAFMSPWKVRKQLKESARIIKGLTGEPPVFYRPPWGIFNLFDLLHAPPYKVVLWSVMVGDWIGRGSSDRLKQRLDGKLREGDILVLHDCGETFGADREAPLFMLEALKFLLETTCKQGAIFSRVDELTQETPEEKLKQDVRSTAGWD